MQPILTLRLITVFGVKTTLGGSEGEEYRMSLRPPFRRQRVGSLHDLRICPYVGPSRKLIPRVANSF